MSPESACLQLKDGPLHQKVDQNSNDRSSPRSGTTSLSSSNSVHTTIPSDQCRKKSSTPKFRRTSFFCFIFLLFTASLVFVQLLLCLFNTPLISGTSEYEINPEGKFTRELQHLEGLISESGRLRFPRKRRLPQCIIIGVKKGGTRALLKFMNLHPMIQRASKEIHFFDRDDNYALGLEWYRSQMPYSFPRQVTVEKTPAYFVTPAVPARIRKMDPSVKLLLVVREPVTRLISDYTQMAFKKARENKTLNSFEKLVFRNGIVNVEYDAVRFGMYALYFQNWLRTFPRKQIHIVDGDNLIVNPFSEIRKIEDFLCLDHKVLKENFYFNDTKGFFCLRNQAADKCLDENKGRKHTVVSKAALRTLRRFYEPHNNQFFKQAGLNLNWTVE